MLHYCTWFCRDDAPLCSERRTDQTSTSDIPRTPLRRGQPPPDSGIFHLTFVYNLLCAQSPFTDETKSQKIQLSWKIDRDLNSDISLYHRLYIVTSSLSELCILVKMVPGIVSLIRSPALRFVILQMRTDLRRRPAWRRDGLHLQFRCAREVTIRGDSSRNHAVYYLQKVWKLMDYFSCINSSCNCMRQHDKDLRLPVNKRWLTEVDYVLYNISTGTFCNLYVVRKKCQQNTSVRTDERLNAAAAVPQLIIMMMIKMMMTMYDNTISLLTTHMSSTVT